MYLKINAGIDRANTIYKLMSGVKPQDLTVKLPSKSVPKNVQKSEVNLFQSVKNIITKCISKGK